MKICSFLLLCLAILTACSDHDKGQSKQLSLGQFADSLFQANVDESFIAGASVMVVQDDEIILDKAYGFANLELSTPMPKNGSFEIGSVTKQFTAAAILRLEGEGKLSLDDDLTKYLEFDTRGRKVSIRKLLNHTSGIYDYAEIPEYWNLAKKSFTRDSLIRLIEQKEFLFEPGEALIYSTSGYFFLASIIETISGKSYGDYLKAEFFEPLGMKNTYYCSNEEVENNGVKGYDYSEDGLHKNNNLDHTWPHASGTLCSSSEDLVIWMRALHGGNIFNDFSYDLMTQPGVLNDGIRLRYAMGLDNFSFFGHHLIGHLGGMSGFLTDTRYFPDENLYIVCLVNTMGPVGALFFTDEITWYLLDKKEFEAVPIDVDIESMKGMYIGQGRGGPTSLDVSIQEKSLVIKRDERDDPERCAYIGNSTWYDGIRTYQFKEKEWRLDNVAGHYILKKQDPGPQ